MTPFHAPAPQPSSDLPERLAGIMESLSALMAEEQALLARHDMKALGVLVPRKEELAVACQSATRALTPTVVASLTPRQKARLKAARDALASRGASNALSLQAAIRGARTLLGTLMDCLREEVRPQHCYADPRRLATVGGARETDCRPVVLRRLV